MAPSAHLKCGSQPGSPSRTASLCWCISYSAQHVNCGKERKLLKETIHSSPCERGSNYRVSSAQALLMWLVCGLRVLEKCQSCVSGLEPTGRCPPTARLTSRPRRARGPSCQVHPYPWPASGRGRWDHRLQRNPSEADPSLEALLLPPYLSERIGPDHSLMISPVLSASFSAAGSAWGGQGINIA